MFFHPSVSRGTGGRLEIKIKQRLSAAALKSLLRGLALLQGGQTGDLPPVTAPEALVWLSEAGSGCAASCGVAGPGSCPSGRAATGAHGRRRAGCAATGTSRPAASAGDGAARW